MRKIIVIALIILPVINFVYADVSLNDIIRDYKDNSLTYKKEYTDYSIYRNALLASISPYLPQISFNISADSSNGTSWMYSQTITASQTILNVPKILNMINAKKQADIARNNFYSSQFTTISDIIEIYFTLLEYQKRIELDSLLIEREKNNISKSSKMFKSGIISKTDLLNIESNYHSVNASYYNNRQMYITAANNFFVLTGIKNEKVIDIDTIPYMDTDIWNTEDILHKMPEYISAKKSYETKSINAVSAYTEFLPTASLSVSAGISDSVLSFDYNNFINNQTLRAGLSVNFPVFTGFSRSINIINTSMEKKSQYFSFKTLENVLLTEIENFPVYIEQTIAEYESTGNVMKAQSAIFEKSQILFEKGELSSAEYISYEENYISSVINHIQTQKRLYIMYYKYLYYLRRIK